MKLAVPTPRSFRDFYAFERHVKTCRAHRGLEMPPVWYQQPVFYFSNPGSIVGNDAEVFSPADSHELDYELELGLVIGPGGRDIPADDAWRHVSGFTIINDLSAARSSAPGNVGRAWPGKRQGLRDRRRSAIGHAG